MQTGREIPAATPVLAVSDSGVVRIMTWNIRYDNPDDGVHAWPRRRDEVVSFVRSRSIDILCIQEGLRNQVRFIEEGLQGFEMRGVGRDDGKEQGEYSAIFFTTSRFTAGEDGTFWLSPTPSVPGKGWDAALSRIVTWVRLVDSSAGGAVYVFNTHFDHEGTAARENSARLLRSKIGEIAGTEPVVVTGDFNAVDTDPPYRVLTSPDAPLPGLKDAMRRSLSPPDGPRMTFTGFEPAAADSGIRIDYVFVSEGLQVLRHSTFPARGTTGFLSDHLPVVVEFLLPLRR